MIIALTSQLLIHFTDLIMSSTSAAQHHQYNAEEPHVVTLNISVNDGLSASHIFSEIFINECYPIKKSNKKRLIIDIGANVGFFTFYALIKSPNVEKRLALYPV